MTDESTGGMTQSDATDLWTLRIHWEDAYHIALVDGVWRAKRVGNVMHVLTADSAHELKVKMQEDFAEWQSAERNGS